MLAATEPVKVPFPLPTKELNVNDPIRSDPAVTVPVKFKLTTLGPLNVPTPVKRDPF